MELWVRSQDKERLGKIVYLELKNDDYGFHIIGWRDKFEGTKIATYKTKERALEVLDEIQKIFDFRIENKSYEEADIFLKANMFPKIYQMPEE